MFVHRRLQTFCRPFDHFHGQRRIGRARPSAESWLRFELTHHCPAMPLTRSVSEGHDQAGFLNCTGSKLPVAPLVHRGIAATSSHSVASPLRPQAFRIVKEQACGSSRILHMPLLPWRPSVDSLGRSGDQPITCFDYRPALGRYSQRPCSVATATTVCSGNDYAQTGVQIKQILLPRRELQTDVMPRHTNVEHVRNTGRTAARTMSNTDGFSSAGLTIRHNMRSTACKSAAGHRRAKKMPQVLRAAAVAP